jgi:superfamily II DNA or RNA helicase
MNQASGKKLSLSLKAVQEASSEPVYRRGIQYYRRKKVLKYEEINGGSLIEALVIGSESQPYKIRVVIDSPEQFTAECSCPYFEPVCKHSVAVLLTNVAKNHPGIRFDIGESDRQRENVFESGPRAKDFLEDPRAQAGEGSGNEPAEVSADPSEPEITLGVLVIEKPLALILGTIPDEIQGKVNILKIPPEALDYLPAGSRAWKLAKYLTMLPQITKGPAGGHRIPRADEGCVLGHASLCARLINTSDNKVMTFSQDAIKPRLIISETENGELSLRLLAITEDGKTLAEPLFFLGQSSYVLADGVFYFIDASPLSRLFQFFDSYGKMTVKLDVVPKFLSQDIPNLMKKLDVQLDESSAPFPMSINEPPQVVIRLVEKRPGQGNGNGNGNGNGVHGHNGHGDSDTVFLDLALGFRYGNLVLPSRDETSAVESEVYTRTISEEGQSVWVKRLWDQEGQLRRFLTNLQPTRTIADRFYFIDEAACDAVFYLSSEQSSDWEIQGINNLHKYRVMNEPVKIKANLMLNKDAFKFEFQLQAFAADQSIPFTQIIDSVFRNRNYLQLEVAEGDKQYVRLPVQTLLSLLKAVGQSKETARPLYQALPIAAALEAHGIDIEYDQGFSDFIEKLCNFRTLEPQALHKDFRGSLREYQKEGYSWLKFLREYGLGGILADDMGLGKTIQTLALLLAHHKNAKRSPSLVVAPTSVVYNWMMEAEKFTPTLNTALFLGRDRHELLAKLKRQTGTKPDVVFTTYGIIRRDYEALKEVQFDHLILDEAQNIKNPESVGAIASKSLKALHRLALSGTPVENRLRELWSIFDFLMPDFLGEYKEFNETFERPIESGNENSGQKLRKIVHPFILRRLKSQVEKELPDRTDVINLCEMEDDQRSLYLDVLDECRQKVFGEIASKGIGRSQISVLAALLRLRQVCCDPRLLKNRPADETLPESGKLEALMEMVDELVEGGHKMLIFSQFVEMLSLIRPELEKAGYEYEYIDGQTPAKDRLDKVNKFNADPTIPIFLISLKAGGTGLNLTGADYVIHYDPWWNPAVENQATDRAHRIGQTKHVFNYKLITKGTVEEKILALQKRKQKLADLIIGGDEGIAKELTKEDLEFLFSF